MSYYEHCKNCENFYQHYVIVDGYISQTSCGHCKTYNLERKNNKGCCEQFIESKKKKPNLKKLNQLGNELIKISKNMSNLYALRK